MQIERVRPESLYAGAPYAYASVVPEGRLVFSAGACPLASDGSTVAPGDHEAQAHQAVANLFTALAAAGAIVAQNPTAAAEAMVGVVRDLS